MKAVKKSATRTARGRCTTKNKRDEDERMEGQGGREKRSKVERKSIGDPCYGREKQESERGKAWDKEGQRG